MGIWYLNMFTMISILLKNISLSVASLPTLVAVLGHAADPETPLITAPWK